MARIVIQAGHCHRKTDSVGTQTRDGSFTEQQFSWTVANRARDLMLADGQDAVAILADEPNSRYRGDAFLAIHADGNSSANVGGASVGYRTNEGKALAHAWKTAYRKLGWTHGFRADNYTAALGGYYGVKRAVAQGNRRACILEFGFLTNPAEAAELRSEAGLARAARSVRCAAYASLGIAAPHPAPDPEDEDMATVLAHFRTKAGSDDNRHTYRVTGNVASWCGTQDEIAAAEYFGASWFGPLDPPLWESLAVINGPLANQDRR